MVRMVGMMGLALFLVACSAAPAAMPTPTLTPRPSPTVAAQDVVLTLGAWRTSTAGMNRVLSAFSEVYPHITVRFDPTTSGEYDAVLDAQLAAGTAPDLFFLRSFSSSYDLYDAGYLAPLEDLPGLREHFDPAMLAPWISPDGIPYGVPFTATSHGIYYNQDLFADLGLTVPQTWEELLETAEVLETAGVIPFANGSKDAWTAAEIVFMNIAPNFIGGREGRMAYLHGDRCFDDDHVIAAFQGVADLAPYFPDDHRLLGYVDSLELFVQRRAGMWMSGSWDIPYLEDAQPDFAWSVFAVPPPAGEPGYVTFHLDVAIGLNAVSSHREEARLFLDWMTTPAFAALLGNEMPGYFPMHREAPQLLNPHANTFLALNQGRGTDIRFAWELLRDGSPSGYTLMQEGALAVIRGEQTPQQAADNLQAGLVQWFVPAQTCRH